LAFTANFWAAFLQTSILHLIKERREVRLCAFASLGTYLTYNKALAIKLEKLEKKPTGRLDTHEKAILHILEEIKKLMEGAVTGIGKPKRRIGFH